jgi:hypothetical protein
MDVARRVLLAATARADALAAGDADRLRQLLHPEFIWTSHRGERFNRDDYVHSNIGGRNRWSGQTLQDPAVTVVGDVAVLRCTVVDTVDTGSGSEVFRMPMTQVWIRADAQWVCLAGHAGPRLAPETRSSHTS